MVTIGQNEMTFEARPWHCFGSELLDKLLQLVQPQVASFHQQQHSIKTLLMGNAILTRIAICSSRQQVDIPKSFLFAFN
jgi:hypothetical protein